MKKILVHALLILVFCPFPSFAQETGYSGNPVTSRNIDPLQTYWGDIDQFLDRQSQAALDIVQELLKQFPPSVDEPLERQAAMMLLDTVLHDEKAPHRPAVREFFHDRMELLIRDLNETKVDSGAVIWKLYDHGFVVRTASTTLIFDFTRAYSADDKQFAIPDEMASRILEQCDMLFITHRHGDHADPWVAETFLAQGKPVVAPGSVFPKEEFHPQIIHLERAAHKSHALGMPGKVSVAVTVFPGHQGEELENNVYLVTTPEELTFVHTGDQSNETDFSWIDGIAGSHRVDVLFPNCWTTDITRVVKGIKPQLVITGHENELGHTIDHREPNWLTYDRLQEVNAPYLLMTWGEKYCYRVE